MTAFSRHQAELEWGQLTWEIRSVNHRYLDVTLKLPEQIRHCEGELRDSLRSKLGRGKVDCFARLQLRASEGGQLDLDQQRLAALAAAADAVRAQLGATAPISPLDALAWPGVLREQQQDLEHIAADVVAAFRVALAALNEAREREGTALARLLQARLDGLQAQVDLVRQALPAIRRDQRERLAQRVREIAADFDQGRLEQELVYLAQKSDVDEELDRLDTHIGEIRRVLAGGGPCGRRLDFLIQELNREANTLASKSIAGSTTQAAVEMKVLVEQMREQVQNIE